MIGVQSFPELYTTLIGWQMYDQVWSLLTQTGLAYLPFLGLIIKNVVQPYESQESRSASGTSLRRMEVGFIGMLLLVMVGASPCMPLDAAMVSYTPLCQSEGQQSTYHPGDSGTTYDKAFAMPTGDIRVPLWWYAVLSVSAGITSAANTLVACVPDYRKMITQVDMSQVNDPTIKQQLQQFETDCYLPARAQFLQDNKTNSTDNPIIQNDVSQYGQEDTEWLGSHSFQDTYYQNLKSSQPVPGFLYDPNQDINADSNQENPPAYGSPDCNSWWNDSQNGLKIKLFGALPKDFFDEFKDYFKGDAKLQDDVIKRITTHNGGGYEAADNMVSDVSYSHLAESIGIMMNQLEAYPKIYAIAQAAPILQALLMLMVFTFLPLGIVFAAYKPQTFLIGALIVFSLFFWSFIWHLVSWTDSTLIQALYGSNWFERQTPNASLTDMIIGLLQIVAPLFWFGFMGAVGAAVGNIFSAVSAASSELVSNSSSNVAAAGEKDTVGMLKTAGKVGMKLL